MSAMAQSAAVSSSAIGSRSTLQTQHTNPQRICTHRPRRVAHGSRTGVAAAAGAAGGGSEEVGAAFLQQYKSLAADNLANAQPVSVPNGSEGTGGGCCGGSSSEKGKTEQASGSGCCGGGGGGGAGAAGQPDAASAVMQQLNSMMSGMEGSLTREDMRTAFEATAQAASGDAGERFLDISTILRTGGGGSIADDDADLDALVV